MNDIRRWWYRHLLRELLQYARSLIQQEEIRPAFGTNFLPMWPTKYNRVPIISTKFKLYRPKLGIDGSNDRWVRCIDLNLTGLRTNRAGAPAAWMRLRVWVRVRMGTRTLRCHAGVTKTRKPICWWTENVKECGLREMRNASEDAGKGHVTSAACISPLPSTSLYERAVGLLAPFLYSCDSCFGKDGSRGLSTLRWAS